MPMVLERGVQQAHTGVTVRRLHTFGHTVYNSLIKKLLMLMQVVETVAITAEE